MALYVGIDLGTSGCRAAAIDQSGTLRGFVQVGLPPTVQKGGQLVQNPLDWWSATLDALGRLVKKISAGEIRAIAVDGTSSTVFLIAVDGTPRSPALMYNDNSCVRESAIIQKIAPADCAVHGATSTLAKLLYLQHQDYARNVHYLAHQADWIAGKLTNRFGGSDYHNALKLGYDALHSRWPDWLDRLLLDPGWLPEVREPGAAIGTINRELANRLRIPRDVRICAGTTDSVADFLATGATAIGDAVTSLGSTLAMKILSAKPIFAPRYGVYSHRLQDRWLVGGASSSGGAVLHHFFSAEQIKQLSTHIDPACDTGLRFYPLLRPGERFPINDPDLSPCLEPRPESDVLFLHAMLEGIARIEYKSYGLLSRLGAPYPRSLRTAGSGAQNTAWTKLRNRFLQVPLAESTYQQAACGTALLARSGLKKNASNARTASQG